MEFIPTSIIEPFNIDEYLYENTIAIFITKKDLNKTYYYDVTEDDDRNSFEISYSKNSMYNDSNRSMVSCWVIDSYFNTEKNQIGDIDITTSAYGSSGSFGSRVGSKYIGNNTYTRRRSNFNSKPAPINGPVKFFDLNYSYSRIHFSRLPQVVAEKLIYHFLLKLVILLI